jgi:diguanylate cyclase (GGDEF)-like protein/PAS domain S-box-containing protein
MRANTNALNGFMEGPGELAASDYVPPILSGEFLVAALAGAGIGTWQLDMLSGLFTWDAVTSTILGLQPVAMTSGEMFPIHADDQDALWESLNRSFATGEPHDMVFRGLHADGGIRWLHGLARPLPPHLGKSRFMAGTVSDVTERKLAEIALSESERHRRAIVESLPGIAYRCDIRAPWKMSFISDSVEELTGFTPEDFTSGKMDWGDIIATQDAARVEAEVANALALGRPFELRYRICTRDGLRWVHEKGKAAYASDGPPLFLEGFVGDVHEQTTADDMLRETEERYRLVIRATGDLIWDWDLASDQVTWNETISSKFGYAPETIDTSRQWWTARLHPEDRNRVLAEIETTHERGQASYSCQYRFQRGDGGYSDILDRGYVIRDRNGRAVRMLGAMQDLTERNAVSAALRQSVILNQSIMDASADCIKIVSLSGALEMMNAPGLCAMELDSFESVRGKHWADLWPPQMRASVQASISEAGAGLASRFSGFCPTARGVPKWWDVVVTPMSGEDGRVEQLLAISRDITANRQQAENLLWASEHDALTGLPNRRAFEAHLKAATFRAMQRSSEVGLLLLDLDHFKHVNDTLGHAAGDHLLRVFGKRLKQCVRGSDFIARLGGDEFAVIMEGCGHDLNLPAAGESILSRLKEPIKFKDRVVSAGASIGGARFPSEAQSANELFDNADIALYALKESGRGGTMLFHQHMREEAQIVSSQLALARNALTPETVEPHYQPKVDLVTGEIVGFEALLRWRHATRGVQNPASVAEAFKDYELARRIGDLMQRRVFSDMRRWLDMALPIGFVALNAAPVEFLRDDFAERLLAVIQDAGIPPSLVEVEVTEHVFLNRGSDFVGRALKVLSHAGVKVALDDFGTGYSSLSHLRDYPVDVVKIDRSFIEKVTIDPEVAAIVCAVIDLAKSLNIEVVAEGIETECQRRFLVTRACGLGQGYLFGRAVEGKEVPSLVTSTAPRKLMAG